MKKFKLPANKLFNFKADKERNKSLLAEVVDK
jgi:hypothetical protein